MGVTDDRWDYEVLVWFHNAFESFFVGFHAVLVQAVERSFVEILELASLVSGFLRFGGVLAAFNGDLGSS